MSFPASVLGHHDLTAGERLTLITMYAMAPSGSDVVWQTARSIARILGYQHRGIQSHIKALTEAGWVESISERDPRGGGRFHGYRLLKPMRPADEEEDE